MRLLDDAGRRSSATIDENADAASDAGLLVMTGDEAESRLLWQMGALGPITPDALAARLGLDPFAVGAQFDALVRRGHVRLDRQGVPDLTASGRHALVALVRAGLEERAADPRPRPSDAPAPTASANDRRRRGPLAQRADCTRARGT
jgi:hypothetical protein